MDKKVDESSVKVKELVLEMPEEDVTNDIKYKKNDTEGGYIYDADDVKYFQTVQSTDVIDNLMLGGFNKKGEYVIAPTIVNTLIKMPKIYTDAYEKSIYLESLKEFSGYGRINFRLKIIPSKNGTSAILEILETVNKVNGYYQNTNHVALAGIKVSGENATEQIYKYFNIGQDDPNGSDGALTEYEEVDPATLEIINRIEYLKIIRQGSNKFMQKYQKDLYNKRIELLKKSKIGATILEEFNQEYFKVNSKFLNAGSSEYYKHLNQLLDCVLENNIDVLKSDADTMKDLKTLSSSLSNLYEKDLTTVIRTANKYVEQKNLKVENNIVEKAIDGKQTTVEISVKEQADKNVKEEITKKNDSAIKMETTNPVVEPSIDKGKKKLPKELNEISVEEDLQIDFLTESEKAKEKSTKLNNVIENEMENSQNQVM